MSREHEDDVVDADRIVPSAEQLWRGSWPINIRRAVVNVRHEAKRAPRRRGKVAAALWVGALVTYGAAVSSAQDGASSDWERPSSTCEPFGVYLNAFSRRLPKM